MIWYFTDYSKGGASFVLTMASIFANLMEIRAVSEVVTMALIDKLGRDAQGNMGGRDAQGNMRPRTHDWASAIKMYMHDELTKAGIIAAFSLEVDDELSLSKGLAYMDSLTGAERQKYFDLVEPRGIWLETRNYTHVQYMSLMGF